MTPPAHVRSKWADGSLFGVAALFVAMVPLAWVNRRAAGFSNYQTGLAVPLAFGAWRLTKLQLWRTLEFGRAAKAAFFGAAWVWLVAAVVCRWAAFELPGVDFSIFDWMLHGVAHGRFGWSPIYEVNHFGVHPSWVLLVLVPMHLLSEGPMPLLVAGATLYALGAWVLFRLAAPRVGEALALLLALAFLTHPLNTGVVLLGLRPESFYPVLLLAFLWAWETGRAVRIALAAVGVLSIKEDAALVLGAFALGEALFVPERRRAGVALLIASVAWLTLNLAVVQPGLLAGSPSTQPEYLHFWAQLGDTGPHIVVGALTHPLSVLAQIATSRWWFWLGAMLFLPLLSRRAVFGMAPTVVLIGSSTYLMMHRWESYYPAPIVAFAFYGLMQAANDARLGRWKMFVVALVAIGSPLIRGGMAIARPDIARLEVMRRVRERVASLEHVCAQGILFPHLGHLPGLKPWFDDSCRVSGTTLVAAPELDPAPFTREWVRQTVDAARAEGRVEDAGEGVVLIHE